MVSDALLDLAIRRPWTSAFGEEQFKTPFDKAAAIAESIAHNSPFTDGNKRTASVAMRLMLELYEYELRNRQEDRIELLTRTAAGEIGFENVRDYIARYAVLRPR